jgi:hypothetical protein
MYVVHLLIAYSLPSLIIYNRLYTYHTLLITKYLFILKKHVSTSNTPVTPTRGPHVYTHSFETFIIYSVESERYSIAENEPLYFLVDFL